MALYVCAWMQDWNLSLAWISFHQSKNTRSSKATIESFKQPQWNLAKLQSPSPAEQGTNALIYTSTRFWREDKNELEKKALCGSCNVTLTDSHSLVRLSNKVRLMTWMLGWSGWACHSNLSMGEWMLEGTEVFDWCRGIQARYRNSWWCSWGYTVHLWTPHNPSAPMMTGDWGGGVKMALMLAARITNPGHPLSADT